ncbi:MAG: hypothetical protein N4A31_01330 [Rickettsiales bacterium]|jgi:hypothetical protein|nr:hypothetical protein [Rickettsiales bacterium]
MTTQPTPAPTPFETKNRDGLNGDDSGDLLIPLTLLFGSVVLTVGSFCGCYYKDNICGVTNSEPLLGSE